MGVACARVAGSVSSPAWIARVEKPSSCRRVLTAAFSQAPGRGRVGSAGATREHAADLEAEPFATTRLDDPACLADDVLHDRETKARAAGCARVVGAVEPLEQPGELLLVDADAVIGAAQDDRVVLTLDRKHEA